MLQFADKAGDADEGMYREVVMAAKHTTFPSALAAQQCRKDKSQSY